MDRSDSTLSYLEVKGAGNTKSPTLMVRYRVLRRKDVPEVQAVALKAWMFAYRRYGLSLRLIQKFVSERYSTESFERTVFPSIQKGESQFYLATDKGKIIGYSNAGPGVWGWELYRIYLLPEYIGKGVGRKLLLLCEDFLREKKARKYHAYVWEKNEAALDFYKRNGFAKLEGNNKNKVEICKEKKLTNSTPPKTCLNKSPIFTLIPNLSPRFLAR